MKTLICGLKITLFVKLLFLMLCSVPFIGIAQINERVYMSDSRLDSTKKGELSFEIDNISFFQNNEFSSGLVKGYTCQVCGFNPKPSFTPSEALNWKQVCICFATGVPINTQILPIPISPNGKVVSIRVAYIGCPIFVRSLR